MSQTTAGVILIISLVIFAVIGIGVYVTDHWINVEDLAYSTWKRLHIRYPHPNVVITFIMKILYRISM